MLPFGSPRIGHTIEPAVVEKHIGRPVQEVLWTLMVVETDMEDWEAMVFASQELGDNQGKLSTASILGTRKKIFFFGD